jgi:hypothetical protein
MKNGVDMIPTNLPTVSPNNPGISRQNSNRDMAVPKTTARIAPPTKICLPLFSVACSSITPNVNRNSVQLKQESNHQITPNK